MLELFSSILIPFVIGYEFYFHSVKERPKRMSHFIILVFMYLNFQYDTDRKHMFIIILKKKTHDKKKFLAHGPSHTRLTSTKRFTNLKINLEHLGVKMQLVSYEFQNFCKCIMTYWGLRDFKGPISMHQAHLVQT